MYKLYGIIAAISMLIRQFFLPNPFESLGDSITVEIANMTIPLTPEILNWIAEPILHAITFAIVGLYYTKGMENPAKGSFLYPVFYCIHVGLIFIVSNFGFSVWAIIAVIVIYVTARIGFNALKNKFICGGI